MPVLDNLHGDHTLHRIQCNQESACDSVLPPFRVHIRRPPPVRRTEQEVQPNGAQQHIIQRQRPVPERYVQHRTNQLEYRRLSSTLK